MATRHASLRGIQFTENKPLDVDQLNELYRIIRWDKKQWRSKETTQTMLDMSHYYVAAHTPDKQLVGFARVCGDPYVVQVLDLITHPDFRKRGIANECMRHVTRHLQASNYVSVTLTDGTNIAGFYQKFGFRDSTEPALVWKPSTDVSYQAP